MKTKHRSGRQRGRQNLRSRVSALLGGYVQVPLRRSSFGKYLDLTDRIPADADCIMVLINDGGGLNAGYPQPIGFIKLTQQLYRADVKKLLEKQADQLAPFCSGTQWITVVPVRSKEYVDVWSTKPPNGKDKL